MPNSTEDIIEQVMRRERLKGMLHEAEGLKLRLGMPPFNFKSQIESIMKGNDNEDKEIVKAFARTSELTNTVLKSLGIDVPLSPFANSIAKARQRAFQTPTMQL